MYIYEETSLATIGAIVVGEGPDDLVIGIGEKALSLLDIISYSYIFLPHRSIPDKTDPGLPVTDQSLGRVKLHHSSSASPLRRHDLGSFSSLRAFTLR
jgi:hypothetical protein